RLRALAIASRTRHPALDKVPTTAEAGLPALLVENWTGMMAPAGMSDAAVRKLGAEVVEIVHQPEMQERMRQQGFNADARPPERFAVFLNEEIARWAQVEIMAALADGFSFLKLFPAEAVGGMALLKSWASPFARVSFCPTGGITQASAPHYLALPQVRCVGGSWLTPADAIRAGDWARITALARASHALRNAGPGSSE
ncbi:hypothetical protein ET532_014850, partial [Verminephrobacter sp. Larva24]